MATLKPGNWPVLSYLARISSAAVTFTGSELIRANQTEVVVFSVCKWVALIVCLVPCLAFGAPAPLPVSMARGYTVTVKWEQVTGLSAEIVVHHIRPGVFLRDYLLKTTIPQDNLRHYQVWIARKQNGEKVILTVDLVTLFSHKDSSSNYLLIKGDVLFISQDRQRLFSSDTAAPGNE